MNDLSFFLVLLGMSVILYVIGLYLVKAKNLTGFVSQIVLMASVIFYGAAMFFLAFEMDASTNVCIAFLYVGNVLLKANGAHLHECQDDYQRFDRLCFRMFRYLEKVDPTSRGITTYKKPGSANQPTDKPGGDIQPVDASTGE